MKEKKPKTVKTKKPKKEKIDFDRYDIIGEPYDKQLSSEDLKTLKEKIDSRKYPEKVKRALAFLKFFGREFTVSYRDVCDNGELILDTWEGFIIKGNDNYSNIQIMYHDLNREQIGYLYALGFTNHN